uniref:Sex hormone binding globulin n=1 Tax=Homo sapiens TaxID=9606 RepID=B0FWH8_HUMAN|nr:sex hormone binding globulin [Homo sapiens]ABY68005.1 sex hormone binding globulin [Homo sapiens]ABY68006.1 sex hormone binding globulin [Homo sapiens]ABY68007.1 sex hormone binding globulin [Homo sapiens]ABY68008.1 sex hormone binding globulin [Homo sapiens]
MAQDKSLSLS